jgi:hypothetical protein
MAMQQEDIERLGLSMAEYDAITTRDKALGIERNHIRDELIECVYRLNVAEPSQLPKLLERFKEAMAALEKHVADVKEHWG